MATDITPKKDLTKITDLGQAPEVSTSFTFDPPPESSISIEAPSTEPSIEFNSAPEPMLPPPSFTDDIVTLVVQTEPSIMFDSVPTPPTTEIETFAIPELPDFLSKKEITRPIQTSPSELVIDIVDKTEGIDFSFTPSIPEQSLKDFSEKHSIGELSVDASVPFTLYIKGELEPYEKERLLTIISSENVGIREIDLTPQIEAQNILIPRVSEYTATLIIQALRATRATIQLQSIQDSDHPQFESQIANKNELETTSPTQNVSPILISTGGNIPEVSPFETVDFVSASMTLKAKSVEIETTDEYQTAVENLKRKLKFLAAQKGAHGIIYMQTQLFPLMQSSHYRITLHGTAIKRKIT